METNPVLRRVSFSGVDSRSGTAIREIFHRMPKPSSAAYRSKSRTPRSRRLIELFLKKSLDLNSHFDRQRIDRTLSNLQFRISDLRFPFVQFPNFQFPGSPFCITHSL